jgi:hypothetical protein
MSDIGQIGVDVDDDVGDDPKGGCCAPHRLTTQHTVWFIGKMPAHPKEIEMLWVILVDTLEVSTVCKHLLSAGHSLSYVTETHNVERNNLVYHHSVCE